MLQNEVLDYLKSYCWRENNLFFPHSGMVEMTNFPSKCRVRSDCSVSVTVNPEFSTSLDSEMHSRLIIRALSWIYLGGSWWPGLGSYSWSIYHLFFSDSFPFLCFLVAMNWVPLLHYALLPWLPRCGACLTMDWIPWTPFHGRVFTWNTLSAVPTPGAWQSEASGESQVLTLASNRRALGLLQPPFHERRNLNEQVSTILSVKDDTDLYCKWLKGRRVIFWG